MEDEPLRREGRLANPQNTGRNDLGEQELDVGNLIAHLALTDLQEIGTIGTAPLLRLASLARLAQPGLSVLTWPELAGALLSEADRVMTPDGAPRAGRPARP